LVMFQKPSSDFKKSKTSHSAVSSTHDCSKRLTFYFFGRFIHSNTASTPLGGIEPYTLHLMHVEWSCSYQAYQASFSFMQHSELEQCRVQQIFQSFNNATHVSNHDYHCRETNALPRRHCVQ